MVQLEALACGVPVVTTPQCGGAIRDGQEGFIVPVRDAQALADRIERIIVDRQLRERMSHAARLKAQDLDWNRFATRLLAATRVVVQDGARIGEVN